MGIRNRLPIAFLIAGVALKGLLVLTWRLFRSPELLDVLTIYDPGAFWFAEKASTLLFGERRIAPTFAESGTFESLLVIGFGIECFVVGLIICWFLRNIKGADEIHSDSPATRA